MAMVGVRQAIRTPNQKRTQILLTLEYIRLLKKKFNEHFDALFRAKVKMRPCR